MNGELIASTPSEGTFVIFTGLCGLQMYLYNSIDLFHVPNTDGSHILTIDKSLPVSQLAVAHKHKLLLLRSGTIPMHIAVHVLQLNFQVFIKTLATTSLQYL